MPKARAKTNTGKRLSANSEITASSSPESESPREPQQDRGQRRVEEILDAAQAVVSEVGWEAATTQLIAERAQSSMGSLYHFFPTKDAILVALAKRYCKLILDANERAMPMTSAWDEPHVLFERVIRAQVNLSQAIPAFPAIHDAIARRFGCEAGPFCELDEAIYKRVRAFCAMRMPHVKDADREAAVRLMVGVVHRAMLEAQHVPPQNRESIFRGARDMLAGYLAHLDQLPGHPVRTRDNVLDL